jgi:putative ABC transport system substrate-binding protein
LELLHELVPKVTSVGLLVNSSNPMVAESQSTELRAAARSLGVELHVLQASSAGDLRSVFAGLNQLGLGALVIATDPFFNTQIDQLATLALRYAVPAIYSLPEFAAKGGIMSYGGSVADQFRIAGGYVGRILRGEKPADLPVQQSTKVELILNLKTAKALGLTIPETLLATADEVIQ